MSLDSLSRRLAKHGTLERQLGVGSMTTVHLTEAISTIARS
ncbi:MAG TPA: hypothetical protein VFN22_12145 [Gemmatimonadales bacterium]|nr:hypothetical protein [Gemmatimonadales bacterium]